jgi:hypothetical protein
MSNQLPDDMWDIYINGVYMGTASNKDRMSVLKQILIDKNITLQSVGDIDFRYKQQ